MILLRVRTTGFFILAALLLFFCDEADKSSYPVLIGADPPSLYKGESLSIELLADTAYFVENKKDSIVSNKGLTLKSIVRKNDHSALAVVESDDNTAVGLHDFELNIAGRKAMLQVSVLMPSRGPGEVRAERNMGSSGVELASFTIIGEGTKFDKWCTATSVGAEGFVVRALDVESATKINVYYTISIDQEPTEAKVIVQDGDYRYESPFTIVSHLQLKNEIENQFLIRGQVGQTVVYHKDATLLSSTVLDGEDSEVETGLATIGSDHAATIPVRVPVDYESDEVHLTSKTFTDSSSSLELIDFSIQVIDPQYAVFKNARLDTASDKYERVFITKGFEVKDIKKIEIEDESGLLTVADWKLEGENIGSAVIFLDYGLPEGAYNVRFETITGQTLRSVLIVSDRSSARANIPIHQVAAGDRLFVPMAVQGGDLAESVVAMTEHDDIEVMNMIYIDAFTVVMDIATKKDSLLGVRRISLSGEKYNYSVSLEIVSSGV